MSKGEKQLSPTFCYQIFGRPVMKFLGINTVNVLVFFHPGAFRIYNGNRFLASNEGCIQNFFSDTLSIFTWKYMHEHEKLPRGIFNLKFRHTQDMSLFSM